MYKPTGVISDKHFELVDVTMRDGALGRKFPYSLAQLREYLHLLEVLGIKYAEIGFIGGPGKWAEGKVASPNYDITPELNRLLHTESSLKLWSMIDSDNPRLEKEHVHANKESLVRITADLDKVQLLQEKIDICSQKDIPFSVNLKYTGNYELGEIQSIAEFAQDQGAQIFYIVDTSGTMVPWQAAQITRRLKSALSIELGFHGHDSLGFAAANSLAAIDEGCKYIDVSLCGIGAGGGNAVTEIFLLLAKGERCDWNSLVKAGKLLNIPPEYRELQERIFWGFIGCNTTTKNDLTNGSSENTVANKAMEWKYGRILSKGEHTTLRLLNRPMPIVTKTATGDGIRKIAGEISFLELNKSKLRYNFLPDIYSHEITKQYAYYSMPYLSGPLLRDYIYSESDFVLTSQSIEKVVTDLNILHLERGKIDPTEFSREFYFERLQKRWKKLQDAQGKNISFGTAYSTANISPSEAQSLFTLIAQGTTLSIDGENVDFSIKGLLDSLVLSRRIFEIPQTSIRLIHGDPHAGNILLHENGAIFLDPNGFLDGGDIAYDFGKLLVSYDWHDLSLMDMIEPAKITITPEGLKVTNNKVYKDSRIETRHKALREGVMDLLSAKVIPIYADDDPMLLQRIKLLLYVHQFSFAPTLIKEKPQTALHILLNAISDYTVLMKKDKISFS